MDLAYLIPAIVMLSAVSIAATVCVALGASNHLDLRSIDGDILVVAAAAAIVAALTPFGPL